MCVRTKHAVLYACSTPYVSSCCLYAVCLRVCFVTVLSFPTSSMLYRWLSSSDMLSVGLHNYSETRVDTGTISYISAHPYGSCHFFENRVPMQTRTPVCTSLTDKQVISSDDLRNCFEDSPTELTPPLPQETRGDIRDVLTDPPPGAFSRGL